MVDNKLLRKFLVYGGNYGARLLGNLGDVTVRYNDEISTGLGHPYTALAFAGWDLAFDNVPHLKQNKTSKTLNKIVKGCGTAYFSFLTIKNLVEFTTGNYEGAAQLPFNASMAASLGMDLKELLSENKKRRINYRNC